MKSYIVKVNVGSELATSRHINASLSSGVLSRYFGEAIVLCERAEPEKLLYPGYILVRAELHHDLTAAIEAMPNVLGFCRIASCDSDDAEGEPTALAADEEQRLLTDPRTVKRK